MATYDMDTYDITSRKTFFNNSFLNMQKCSHMCSYVCKKLENNFSFFKKIKEIYINSKYKRRYTRGVLIYKISNINVIQIIVPKLLKTTNLHA